MLHHIVIGQPNIHTSLHLPSYLEFHPVFIRAVKHVTNTNKSNVLLVYSPYKDCSNKMEIDTPVYYITRRAK